MTLAEFVERVGRTIFEAPFGGGTPRGARSAELAEIRHAILEQLERKMQRTGGRNLFPYNRLKIVIRGADAQQATALGGSFLREYFEQEIRKALSKGEAEYPDGLRVEMEVSSEPPGKGESWLGLSTAFEQTENASAAIPETPRSDALAEIRVVEGLADPPQIVLEPLQTNIGRSVDVYRTHGLSRRNHLAFAEDDEISLTVSREHAHILRHRESGEYRLFNDRFYDRDKGDSCNLWIIRNGASQEVHRNGRGVRLQDGDEIHLGRAVLRFTVQ